MDEFEKLIEEAKETITGKYDYAIVQSGDKKAIVECTAMAFDDTIWNLCDDLIYELSRRLYLENMSRFSSVEDAMAFLVDDRTDFASCLRDSVLDLVSCKLVDKYDEF